MRMFYIHYTTPCDMDLASEIKKQMQYKKTDRKETNIKKLKLTCFRTNLSATVLDHTRRLIHRKSWS